MSAATVANAFSLLDALPDDVEPKHAAPEWEQKTPAYDARGRRGLPQQYDIGRGRRRASEETERAQLAAAAALAKPMRQGDPTGASKRQPRPEHLRSAMLSSLTVASDADRQIYGADGHPYRGPVKTEICRAWKEGRCPRGHECRWAHGNAELGMPKPPGPPRVVDAAPAEEPGPLPLPLPPGSRPLAISANPTLVDQQRYKRRMCTFWEHGKCDQGQLCSFAHGAHELRGRLDPIPELEALRRLALGGPPPPWHPENRLYAETRAGQQAAAVTEGAVRPAYKPGYPATAYNAPPEPPVPARVPSPGGFPPLSAAAAAPFKPATKAPPPAAAVALATFDAAPAFAAPAAASLSGEAPAARPMPRPRPKYDPLAATAARRMAPPVPSPPTFPAAAPVAPALAPALAPPPSPPPSPPLEFDEFGVLDDDEDNAPDAFLCPITHEVMRQPMVAADGRSYERSAIENWFSRSDYSPMTGAKLEHKHLILNAALHYAVERRYGPAH